MKSKLNKTSRQNIEDIYPLSPMQQGMLFHSLYTPESEVYFIQFSCSLTGKVDVPTFEQAWQKIVEKYSIFRTAFVWESSSQPMQVVYRQVQITVESYDWQELSENEQQQQLETFLESDRQKPLPLSQAPLMRLYLIKLDKDNYQFVWSHHHLLLDGWSFPLVFKNLVEFYQLISLGETFSYQPVPSYRNYISWLQRQDKELAEKFWKQKLQGFSAPTPLEVDKRLSNAETNSKNNSKTDNKTKSISFGEKQIQLTESTTTALGSFARVHHLTLNNLVQATWGLLLSRYSQETDVVFGATVSGRPPSIPGIESMVGLFINTLPMRVTVSADTPVLSLLKDLQTQQIEFDQYSYSSLAEIQSWSDIPGGTSLFETIVVFENFPFDTKLKSDTASFEFGNRRVFQQTNYPLTLIVLPHQNFLVKINYDTSKFDDATITRMLGHFQTLLAGMIADPMQPISKLPLLTEIEKQQLLIDWNHTPANYSSDKCIHQLFEEQVEKTPNEIAVVFPSLQDSQEKQQLTYHQLNSRANQLANYLHQNHQIKPNTLIGICVERSLEMIVGILGILKAGGAYIPLDPEYPRERLSFMLEDSQISVLLTQQQFVESLPNHQEQIICLDTEWETIAQYSDSNPLNETTASNLAYIIYTSGSTGKPKGVLVNHTNVTRLFSSTKDLYQFNQQGNQQDVWTMFHSYAFDFSVWEIWGALLHGGRLVVVPYLVTRSPESFYQLLCAEKVTILNQTPSAFRQLIAAEQSIATADDLKLRLIIFGGEALEIKSLQPWFESHGDEYPQLVNMYGITETTVHVTYHPLSKADLNNAASIIGRPIPDLQVYVLDQHLQPVPIGVPGEMYVGGAGVSGGYLNRRELTQQRFISNPFQETEVQLSLPEQASKLYKTGDKARYLSNGDLEYLGRIDQQVKIRGFRIELGEIESFLVQYPGVRESVVVVREDEPDDKRLVAYIVVKSEEFSRVVELRKFLESKLPSYMVPNAFVILESLPLTSNGKIDRRGLPVTDVTEVTHEFVAPRTPTEETIASIWAQVLKVEKVGINDNFFELGGHSLLATQLVSRIRKTFQIEFTLRELFSNVTVLQLADCIEKLKQENSELTVPRILPRTRKPSRTN